MPELHCTICHQTYPCNKFLFQLCGHGFCDDCTKKISQKRKCAACRSEWKTQEPFRIYLDFPEQDKSSRVLHHLERIDKDTPVILAEGMGGMVREIAEDTGVKTDPDKAAALLDAARRLEERVLPLISDNEVMHEEHETLRNQLKIVQAQVKAKVALTTEINRLHQTVLEREASLATVRDELAHEKQKKQSEHDTNRRLTRALRKKQDELTLKDKEIEDLKTQLQERDKQLGLTKTKLRALGRLNKPSAVHNSDDSLLVELPLGDIENVGSLKGLHKRGTSYSHKSVTSASSLLKRRKT